MTTTLDRKQPTFSASATTYMKGIAIIMMVAHPCFLDKQRYEGQDITFIIPEHYWNYVTLFFKICVCIFAFISAYGIALKVNALPEISLPKLTRTMTLPRLVKLLANFMFVFLLVTLFALWYDPARLTKVYGPIGLESIGYYLIDIFGLAEKGS